MSPLIVFETLKSIINFNKLIGRELYPGYFEYQIQFKCNEEAVHARREILKSILKFGPKATVVWDSTSGSCNDLQNGIIIQKSEPLTNENQQYQIRMVRQDFPVRRQLQNYPANVLNNFGNMKLY